MRPGAGARGGVWGSEEGGGGGAAFFLSFFWALERGRATVLHSHTDGGASS